MPASISFGQIALLVFMALFTATAAVIDFRTRRIPNYLTLPAFLLGVVYQVAMNWHDPVRLLDPMWGFALGFGTLLVLWLIGGGGGGDVKLMGAVSIWLGFRATVWVLILSTVVVVLGTMAVMAYGVIVRGTHRTRNKYVAKLDPQARRIVETVDQRSQRRVMTYALPVAIATWAVMAWIHFRPLLMTTH